MLLKQEIDQLRLQHPDLTLPRIASLLEPSVATFVIVSCDVHAFTASTDESLSLIARALRPEGADKGDLLKAHVFHGPTSVSKDSWASSFAQHTDGFGLL